MITPDFCHFVESNLMEDSNKLALKVKSKEAFDIRFALEQIYCLQKARTKLPTWYERRCLFTRRSLEQATAEEVALFKAQLFTGSLLYDLSGGIGADDWAFAQSFQQVISLDQDERLHELAAYNSKRLNLSNVERLLLPAEEYISQVKPDSVVYLDPDRREGTQRKLLLEDCSPKVLDLLPKLQSRGCKVLLKLSPLFEPTEIERAIRGVSRIFAIALHNELKELLVEVLPDFTGKAERVAVNITSKAVHQFAGVSGEKIAESPGGHNWFFEPNVALIKLKLWKAYAIEQGLVAIHSETPYLTGNEKLPGFQGRQFLMVGQIHGSLKQMQQYLKQKGLIQANIAERNAGLSTDKIRKQLKLKDGGNDYLFFVKDSQGKLLGIHAKKEELLQGGR